jgi:hypothetical protein
VLKVKTLIKDYWKEEGIYINKKDERKGELNEKEFSVVRDIHNEKFSGSSTFATSVIGEFAQLREVKYRMTLMRGTKLYVLFFQKMCALKNAIDDGMNELQMRVPKTPAEMQNRDINEFLKPKKVLLVHL